MQDVDGLRAVLGGFDGRRVLVRSDLNVPVDRSGDAPVITDDGRIRVVRGAEVVRECHVSYYWHTFGIPELAAEAARVGFRHRQVAREVAVFTRD